MVIAIALDDLKKMRQAIFLEVVNQVRPIKAQEGQTVLTVLGEFGPRVIHLLPYQNRRPSFTPSGKQGPYSEINPENK